MWMPHWRRCRCLHCRAITWEKSADLGRACIDQGSDPGPLDLLIATVALHHDAEIVTFDADYALIATVSSLKIQLLSRIVGT